MGYGIVDFSKNFQLILSFKILEFLSKNGLKLSILSLFIGSVAMHLLQWQSTSSWPLARYHSYNLQILVFHTNARLMENFYIRKSLWIFFISIQKTLHFLKANRLYAWLKAAQIISIFSRITISHYSIFMIHTIAVIQEDSNFENDKFFLMQYLEQNIWSKIAIVLYLLIWEKSLSNDILFHFIYSLETIWIWRLECWCKVGLNLKIFRL